MNNSQHTKIEIISNIDDKTFTPAWYDIADAEHFWMQWRFNVLLKQIKDVGLLLDKNMYGIEIGCGRGVLRRQIELHSTWTVDGVELNQAALKANVLSRGKSYVYNITEKRPEFKNRYDFLFLYDVLEHLPDPTAFLQDCKFHLKPGGYVFINVPALEIFYSAYDVAVGHLRRYNKTMLTQLFDECQLSLVDIRYWGLSLVGLLLARKILASIKQNPDTIVTRGFKPPAPFFNNILRILMNLETAVIKSPPCGTSIMAIARMPQTDI